MAMFLVRIELHNDKDYNRLYKEMESRRFKKIIDDDIGGTQFLPEGEYILETNLDVEQVRDLAMAAAATASTRYEVLVTEVTTMASFGLRPFK